MYVEALLFLDFVDAEAVLASSRPSPVLSPISPVAFSTVPLVLPSDGTICNSFIRPLYTEAGSPNSHYRYNLAIGVPVEVTAATILLTYWDSNVQHIPLYTAILVVCHFYRYHGLKELIIPATNRS